MKITLRIWRQKNASAPGGFDEFPMDHISEDMSFLEVLDQVNEKLITDGKEPVAFDHDCREGICGTCSMMIDGTAHGPDKGVTACQTHMRTFADNSIITVEPWRAKAFPLIKDLVVDRSAFDRIIQAGGFVSVNTGGTPDANAIPISKVDADAAMDAAACIGCGACVAACKNGSPMLFVSAKVGQLARLPQGKTERYARVLNMVEAMEKEGFGSCTNTNSCEAVCPKEISASFIGALNREYFIATLKGKPVESAAGGG
ncbi:succinate dehydrogenase/fumarate reductase iron-sulfur subunit [Verrucomicrobia bacterium LW23]|nr:succinate dehydrogenase/fumarate reductase iron-sulfur subunit [Verrucomicrobia bacterium LW23]